ncbi:MAG TPA: GntR family transcriptional regulator [Beutenbergiaceae bacterium]|nr:GntR family transcriptional regulator [Beutenbergiaceae bacterium]
MGVEKRSMAEHAYIVLRDRLILLEIPPGSPINESELATELGVGRTPIREALKRLEVDHLVASFPRRGTFATQIDITDLEAVSQMREALEPLASYRAALTQGNGQQAELERTMRDIRSLNPGQAPRELLAYDLQVHRLIYRAAGNELLEETLVRLDNLATRMWGLVIERLPDIHGHIVEHIELIEAILNGDAPAAKKLAAGHVKSFARAVRGVV